MGDNSESAIDYRAELEPGRLVREGRVVGPVAVLVVPAVQPDPVQEAALEGHRVGVGGRP